MIADSVALLRARFGTALRVGWPLFAVLVAVMAYEAPRTPGYFTPALWPEAPDGAADVPDWFWAVSIGVSILVMAWVSAIWFRTVLGGAPVRFAVPFRPLVQVIWHSIIVAVCSLTVAAPILILSLIDVNVAPELSELMGDADADASSAWRTYAQIALYQVITLWALYLVSLSLGLVVVARALAERLGYLQVIYRLEGAWGSVVKNAGALAVFYLLSLGPTVLTLGVWPSIAWMAVLDFWMVMLTFAALAVLYARQIEGRDRV